jgi:hypothetical protein
MLIIRSSCDVILPYGTGLSGLISAHYCTRTCQNRTLVELDNTYKTAPPEIPASSSFIVRPMMMMFIVVLSIFIIQVWSQTITVNTTSGRL